jgi:hypothetical protein
MVPVPDVTFVSVAENGKAYGHQLIFVRVNPVRVTEFPPVPALHSIRTERVAEVFEL